MLLLVCWPVNCVLLRTLLSLKVKKKSPFVSDLRFIMFPTLVDTCLAITFIALTVGISGSFNLSSMTCVKGLAVVHVYLCAWVNSYFMFHANVIRIITAF